MTERTKDDLERQLAELTVWQGEAPELWRKALNSDGRTKAESGPSWLNRPMRFPFIFGSAAVVFIVVVAAISLPSLSRSRALVMSRAERMSESAAARLSTPSATLSVDRLQPQDAGPGYSMQAGLASGEVEDAPKLAATIAGKVASAQGQDPSAASPAPQPRHVIRKANIDLSTADVPTAFVKARHLLRPALGEYVEESSLNGSGKNAYANLTLRVSADRLDDVLNELRTLGTVTTEHAEGQDVTGQVTDLEARLRNERRVETELLELFDKRKDAPLKEILDLRDNIGRVRSEIERMVGQRDQLGRLVALATVLVTLHTDGAPTVEEPPGLRAYFYKVCSNAWHAGLEFLADTLALLLSILIGGILWWVLLAITIIVIRRRLRRRNDRPERGEGM